MLNPKGNGPVNFLTRENEDETADNVVKARCSVGTIRKETQRICSEGELRSRNSLKCCDGVSLSNLRNTLALELGTKCQIQTSQL